MKLEEGFGKLDSIAHKLESGELSLDESISLFDESVKITKECLEILESGKGKLVVIKNELDKLIEEDLDD